MKASKAMVNRFLLTVLLLLLITFCSASNARSDYRNAHGRSPRKVPPSKSIVFILHDAGESYGLKPVIDTLIRSESYETTIVPLGEPAIQIFENYSYNVMTLSEMGISTTVIDGNEGREQELPISDVMKISNSLAEVMTTPWTGLVVCGMAYAMQAQLCKVCIYNNYADEGEWSKSSSHANDRTYIISLRLCIVSL